MSNPKNSIADDLWKHSDKIQDVTSDTLKQIKKATKILDAFDPQLGEKALRKLHLNGVSNVLTKAVSDSNTNHTFNAIPIGLCPDMTGLDEDTYHLIDKKLQAIVAQILLKVAQENLNQPLTWKSLMSNLDSNVFVASIDETKFPDLKRVKLTETTSKTIKSTFSKAKDKLPEIEKQLWQYLNDTIHNDWLLKKLQPEMKKVAKLTMNTDAGGGFFTSKKTTRTTIFSFSFFKVPNPKIPYIQVCTLLIFVENISKRLLSGLTRNTEINVRVEYESRCVTSNDESMLSEFTQDQIDIQADQFMAMFYEVPDDTKQQKDKLFEQQRLKFVDQEIESDIYDEKLAQLQTIYNDLKNEEGNQDDGDDDVGEQEEEEEGIIKGNLDNIDQFDEELQKIEQELRE